MYAIISVDIIAQLHPTCQPSAHEFDCVSITLENRPSQIFLIHGPKNQNFSQTK
jgi:hypothetical protein